MDSAFNKVYQYLEQISIIKNPLQKVLIIYRQRLFYGALQQAKQSIIAGVE